MRKENSLAEYEKYIEDIVPATAHIRKDVGDFIFILTVNAHRGAGTGELYYSRDDALRIQKILSITPADIGVESCLTIPQIFPRYQSLPTNAVANYAPILSANTQ